MDRPGSAASAVARGQGYLFCGFRLEPDGTLHRAEARVGLEPAELALLRFLLAHPGRIVTPAQLRQGVLGETPLSSAAISRAITSLKGRLAPEECIQSLYKRGYRFSAEVRSWAGAPDARPARLAIVPLAAGHGVPDYLAHAVAEETSTLLFEARHAGIVVLPQESVTTLARRGLNAQQVAAAMDADLVLTGNLRVFANRYRLRAEMIAAGAGGQLWVEELLVDRSPSAALAPELANCIASRIEDGGVSISGASHHAAESPEQDRAHELYQRAHFGWQSFERHHMQDALQRLMLAIDLDPALTAACVDLANLSIAQEIHGFMSPAVAANLVRSLAQGACKLQIAAAEAGGIAAMGFDRDGIIDALLPACGWVDFHYYRDLTAALDAFSRSSHLPYDPWITRARTLFALSRHRFTEAIGLLREALLLDPYSGWLHAHLGWALHLAGDRDASVRQTEHTLAEFPGHDGASLFGALILAYNGFAARGVDIARDLAQRRPDFDLAAGSLAYALACAGQTGEAGAVLDRLEWMSRERFVLNSFKAAAFVALGEYDVALELLEAAGKSRCPWFFQLLADPRLAPLHGRPEFPRMKSILIEMERSAAPTP